MDPKKTTLNGGIASTMLSGMRVRKATVGDLVTVKDGKDFVTRPIKPDEAFIQPSGELLCGADAYNRLKTDPSIRDVA
jgi:signal peptidase I